MYTGCPAGDVRGAAVDVRLPDARPVAGDALREAAAAGVHRLPR